MKIPLGGSECELAVYKIVSGVDQQSINTIPSPLVIELAPVDRTKFRSALVDI